MFRVFPGRGPKKFDITGHWYLAFHPPPPDSSTGQEQPLGLGFGFPQVLQTPVFSHQCANANSQGIWHNPQRSREGFKHWFTWSYFFLKFAKVRTVSTVELSSQQISETSTIVIPIFFFLAQWILLYLYLYNHHHNLMLEHIHPKPPVHPSLPHTWPLW